MRRFKIPWGSPAFWVLLISLLFNIVLAVLLYAMKAQPVYIQVEKDKAVWLQLPWQALVTIVAVFAGFASFFLQKYQKDAHFAYSILEDRLKDTLDRYTDPESPLRRASASVRLYEMCFSSSDNRVVAGYDWHPKDIERSAVTQLIAGLVFEEVEKVEDEIYSNLVRLARELPVGSPLADYMRAQAVTYNRRLRSEYCRLLAALHLAFPSEDLSDLVRESSMGRYLPHYREFESCVLSEIEAIEDIEPALITRMKDLAASPERIDRTREVRTSFTKLLRTGDIIVASFWSCQGEIDIDLAKTFTLGLDLRSVIIKGAEFGDAWILECNLSNEVVEEALIHNAAVHQHPVALVSPE